MKAYNKYKRLSRINRFRKIKNKKNNENTDWCTMSPESIKGVDIAHPCCEPHDKCYLMAIIPRVDCDKKFKKCLHDKVGSVVSFIMWSFVRTFGWFFYGDTK